MLPYWLRYTLQNEAPADGEPGGGAGTSPPPSDGAPSAPATTAPDAGASGGGGEASPKDMAEAMWGKESAEDKPPAPKEPVERGEPVEGKAAPKQPKQEDLLRPPEGLSPKAGERFQSLVGVIKEKDQQLQQLTQVAQAAEGRANQFVEIITKAGAGPKEFAEFVEYRTALSSGDYARAQQALRVMANELAMVSGKPIEGVDTSSVLDEFPDLKERVADLQLSEEAALEVARARRIEQSLRARGEQQRSVQQQTQEWVARKDQAMNVVNRMTAYWRQNDIDFAKKEPKIIEKLSRLQNVDPAQWPQALKMMYDDLTDAATLFRPPGPGGPRPISGGGRPSAAAKVAGSMYEAMFGEERPTA